METGIQIYEEDENLEQEIVFDRQVVTRYRYKGSAKPLIDEINYLKEEIQKLKLNKIQQICLVSDKEAKTKIEDLIKRFKSQNIKNIDMMEATTLTSPRATKTIAMTDVTREAFTGSLSFSDALDNQRLIFPDGKA